MSLILPLLYALGTIIAVVLLTILYAIIMDAKATRKSFYIFLILYAVSVSIFGYKVFTNKKIEDNNSGKIKITITGYATEEEFNNIKNNHVLENISEYIDDIKIEIDY